MPLKPLSKYAIRHRSPHLGVSYIEKVQVTAASIKRGIIQWWRIGLPTTFPFEEFTKLDIRVGRVVEAKNVEGSKKLLVLKVDLGGQVKQSVSGIAEFYPPETLVGKNLVVVTNLPPKRLFGLDSEVMILAAFDGSNLSYLMPEKDVPAGTRVN